jgi:hypothetical protein
VAGDGVQPRAQLGRVAQLVQALGGGEEGVVEGVGGRVPVAKDRPAVVVEAVAVTVVNGGEGVAVPGTGGKHEGGVVHRSSGRTRGRGQCRHVTQSAELEISYEKP